MDQQSRYKVVQLQYGPGLHVLNLDNVPSQDRPLHPYFEIVEKEKNDLSPTIGNIRGGFCARS